MSKKKKTSFDIPDVIREEVNKIMNITGQYFYEVANQAVREYYIEGKETPKMMKKYYEKFEDIDIEEGYSKTTTYRRRDFDLQLQMEILKNKQAGGKDHLHELEEIYNRCLWYKTLEYDEN